MIDRIIDWVIREDAGAPRLYFWRLIAVFVPATVFVALIIRLILWVVFK
jgi:hypothetical protein